MEIEKLEFYFDQICTEYTRTQDFPGDSDGKKFTCNSEDMGLIPGKIPWTREWLFAAVLLPGEFHGWRSLMGYSPWGHKESDTNE